MVRLQYEGNICFFVFNIEFFLKLSPRDVGNSSCGSSGDEKVMGK
jgi:hypothetical protein